MRQVDAAVEGRTPTAPYPDQPNRSPWIAQLRPDGPPRPLDADAATDVAIVGAGIAGVATAFFTLRATDDRVMLIERDRVARGATGRNAGQLTTYFERPLFEIADEFGRGHGDRGPTRLRRRARPARPDRRRDRRHGPDRPVHRPHGHVQPEPPAGPSPQQPAPARRRPAPGGVRRLGGRRVPGRDPGGVRLPLHGRAAGDDPRPPGDRRRPVPRRALRPQGHRQRWPARPAGPRGPRAPLPRPLPIRGPDPRRADRRDRRRGRSSTPPGTP